MQLLVWFLPLSAVNAGFFNQVLEKIQEARDPFIEQQSLANMDSMFSFGNRFGISELPNKRGATEEFESDDDDIIHAVAEETYSPPDWLDMNIQHFGDRNAVDIQIEEKLTDKKNINLINNENLIKRKLRTYKYQKPTTQRKKSFKIFATPVPRKKSTQHSIFSRKISKDESDHFKRVNINEFDENKNHEISFGHKKSIESMKAGDNKLNNFDRTNLKTEKKQESEKSSKREISSIHDSIRKQNGNLKTQISPDQNTKVEIPNTFTGWGLDFETFPFSSNFKNPKWNHWDNYDSLGDQKQTRETHNKFKDEIPNIKMKAKKPYQQNTKKEKQMTSTATPTAIPITTLTTTPTITPTTTQTTTQTSTTIPMLEDSINQTEAHLAKVCLHSMSKDVLALCQAKSVKTNENLTDIALNNVYFQPELNEHRENTTYTIKNMKKIRVREKNNNFQKIESKMDTNHLFFAQNSFRKRKVKPSFLEGLASSVAKLISPIRRNLFVSSRRVQPENEPKMYIDKQSWMKKMLRNAKIVNSKGKKIMRYENKFHL